MLIVGSITTPKVNVFPSMDFFQLLIFIEKFSPLPGFEPGTSPVPSRYATNWAILAWMISYKVWYRDLK